RKEDWYFGFGDDPEGARYRLRRDGERWLCTFKQKKILDGIEENRETEFLVSDGEAFRLFLYSLGLTCLITKRKEGESWLVDGVTVELSRVNELGCFVELEVVLSDDAADSDIAAARGRLTALLGRLNVSPASIETRTYTEMIYETLFEIRPASGDAV
ncbi:MAG: class IV adenylate cyclase, partial [Spirochaetales bacterium]|nr:class IV adenylate cyclase [Spirochaetales bacterium]